MWEVMRHQRRLPEEHSEKFVKIAESHAKTSKGKGKGQGKSSAKASAAKGGSKSADPKVTVARVTPKIVPLPFLEDTPAKKQKKDDDQKGQK